MSEIIALTMLFNGLGPDFVRVCAPFGHKATRATINKL
jgi:hypothetical protein